MKSILIGIAGGTGSGKSTFTNRIRDAFGDEVAVIYHDNYYKAHYDMPFEERKKLNYDHPDAFDTDLLLQDLKKLKAGEAIISPTYNYADHNRAEATVRIEPRRVILLEGILALYDKRLRDLMDIKVFVDADADERITRRLIRDMKERGRSAESVVNQYIATVKPMHEKYVEPTKKYADIIIPRGGHNKLAISILTEYLKTVMASED